ncbi:MAG: hypothetical protein IPM52_05395 [Bacteroidetes bacterium]|nr:hypothetical protein [Bacteroidota bacterium]
MASGRQAEYELFRGQYTFFEYESYNYRWAPEGLHISFSFNLAGKYQFSPGLIFHKHHTFRDLSTDLLENLVFNLGMIELISYWKAACPPRLIVRPHSLSREQIEFWKSVYWNGLGEFFHVNGIRPDEENFVSIEAGHGKPTKPASHSTSEMRVLVPIGGGKDSAVSLELLRNTGFETIPLMLNANPAMTRTLQAAGIPPENGLHISRKLDPQLLELNAQGFLNGHTPFSALLAFVTTCAAALSGARHIALSNESSANEATIPGTHINHQYSKSLHFETAFRKYLHTFITPDINYFSLLRPLNELQIAWLFSRMPHYHSAFRSCNVGSKTDSWCGQCPKCLFTATILAPFLHPNELTRIFGKDILSDLQLMPVLESLAGLTDEKPFECVGTTNEVQAAIDYLIRRNHNPTNDLPKALKNRFLPQKDLHALLGQFDENHHLEPEFESILRNCLND